MSSSSFDAVFYVAYPYYFPHFLPIHNYWLSKGKKTLFVLSSKQNPKLMENIAKDEQLTYVFGEHHLENITSKAFFFANENISLKKLNGTTVFLDHGVGTKYCNYPLACETFDLVLIEGTYRQKMLATELPHYQDKIKCVGFSKLDSLMSDNSERKIFLLAKYQLDNNKKTILYAPTFFPSSIEKMTKNFPENFSNCNVIIKPHYLSFERKAYKKQRQLFQHWANFDNCYLAGINDYNLTDFIGLCDIMISDESSAIFEAVALDKPVVVNRFLKLRWTYYLNPKKLYKRLDAGIESYRQVGYNPEDYTAMCKYVEEALNSPQLHKAKRQQVAKEICGVVDGNVSQRIFELLNP